MVPVREAADVFAVNPVATVPAPVALGVHVWVGEQKIDDVAVLAPVILEPRIRSHCGPAASRARRHVEASDAGRALSGPAHGVHGEGAGLRWRHRQRDRCRGEDVRRPWCLRCENSDVLSGRQTSGVESQAHRGRGRSRGGRQRRPGNARHRHHKRQGACRRRDRDLDRRGSRSDLVVELNRSRSKGQAPEPGSRRCPP